jgi:hypothetical protein
MCKKLKIETHEPNRECDRVDTLDPSTQQSNSEKREPNLVVDRTLMLDPKWDCAKTDSADPSCTFP